MAKKRKRGVNGRTKGNGFERQVAKMVVTAFACFGVKTKECYRTPLSGGHLHASQYDPGDLVISKRLRKYFPFKVECKFYRNIRLWPLFTNVDKQKKGWKFKPWLAQTCKGGNGKLHPMLVFKENNGPVICMIPQIMPIITQIDNRFRTKYNGETWYAMLFKDVLRELVREAEDAVE